MRLHLIAVGEKMPSWSQEGFMEYAKRMPMECALKLIEVPMAKRPKNISIDQVVEKESQLLLKSIPPRNRIVALDVRGKAWSTEELAQQLSRWMQEGQDISLLVGGPDGLSKTCLEKAGQRWSLSPLTFPHPLVRVIVAEQLYRAWTILKNHPYHRG